MSKQANIQVFISLRKASIQIPRSSICFSTTFCMQVIEATNLFSTREPSSKLYKFLPTRYFEQISLMVPDNINRSEYDTYTCIYMCIIHEYIVRTYIHTCIHTYIHVCIYIHYIHVYTYIHTYMYN